MTRRSETNEADEAGSSKALAFTVEPSGASTRTTQVIISEFRVRLEAVCDDTTGALRLGFGGVGAGLPEVDAALSM